MNEPRNESTVIRQRVLGLLTAHNRSMSLIEIMTSLSWSGFKEIHPSSVRSILNDLRMEGIAERQKNRWCLIKERKTPRPEADDHVDDGSNGQVNNSSRFDLSPEDCITPDPIQKSVSNKKPSSKASCKCERCDAIAIRGELYCKECRKAVKLELEATGYLTPQYRGHVGDQRTTEQKENTWETKHGTGHG